MKQSQLSKTSLDPEERIGKVLRADNPNDVIQIGLEHGGKDEPDVVSVQESSSKSKLELNGQQMGLTAAITPSLSPTVHTEILHVDQSV